jgi:hypothetical protein
MSADKAGSYPSEAPGRLLALLTDIRLGWKGLPGTNVLASYEVTTYVRKKFYSIDPWYNICG